MFKFLKKDSAGIRSVFSIADELSRGVGLTKMNRFILGFSHADTCQSSKELQNFFGRLDVLLIEPFQEARLAFGRIRSPVDFVFGEGARVFLKDLKPEVTGQIVVLPRRD